VVGVRHCDALEYDIPECHVMVVTMVNQASNDLEDADECFGDGDPMSEASPGVGI
jgi:hypothetical protein